MTNVLIVEDEPLAAQRLERLLAELDPGIRIDATIDTAEETITYLRDNTPDLIFMDIHLADGNSFSIFDEVDVRTPVIFATAYDQYAIRAFKHNSVDYLLKPIDRDELAQSLEKFANQQPNDSVDLEKLMQQLKGEEQPAYQKRFIVTSGEKIKSVKIEEVAYFFGQQKYVFLITHDNRRHIIDYTLTELETVLDPDQFFRINRQFIVGFDGIQSMYAYSKSRVKLELAPPPDMDAIVSIDRSRSFKNWLNR